MNYLYEINAFYSWLKINTPSKSEIALWHAFMHLNNISDWQVVFTVPLTTLSLVSGLSVSDVKRYRNRLVQKGRILWRERKGNQSAQYVIIPFDETERKARECIINEFAAHFAAHIGPQTAPQKTVAHSEPQSAPQVAPQIAPQSAPQIAPINKQNKTEIINDIDNDTESKPRAQDPDDEPYEFTTGIYLSPRQVRDLSGRFHRNYSIFVRLYTELARKKQQGYKPPGSDYEELLKMIAEAKRRNVAGS